MYKYVFDKPGTTTIKTPRVNSISEIKYSSEMTPECIKSHKEFPNGLILDEEQYANKMIIVSNKRIIMLEDGTLGFED